MTRVQLLWNYLKGNFFQVVGVMAAITAIIVVVIVSGSTIRWVWNKASALTTVSAPTQQVAALTTPVAAEPPAPAAQAAAPAPAKPIAAPATAQPAPPPAQVVVPAAPAASKPAQVDIASQQVTTASATKTVSTGNCFNAPAGFAHLPGAAKNLLGEC